ncbi:MAG TPA: aminotransferase class I/II-fold pyridoxal phosphate-dependent enzyme [Polyangiaceae bacterium]|nr:aminotransferase class I/II-fold pyridoxal phosphate-dependent enzyme [Polyangiaceae bacterium]
MANSWPFPRVDTLPTYGFVVTDSVKARVLARGVDLIDLGLGNPDRPTPKQIVAQLHEQADIGTNHRYHPGRGIPPLRDAAARWYQRRYGARFDVNREVVITMGAKEGMSHLCLAVLDVGDVVIVPDPCYPIHAGAPRIAGAEVEYYQATPDIAPAAAVAAALARVKARGKRTKLVIANYPQNPTGQVVTKRELGDLVQVVGESGAMLLHDLAYADFDFQSRFAPSVFDVGVDPELVKSFAVEVFSASKSYNMPGWRIAFMVGNERMISALAHLKTYLDYGTFAPIQLAAAWALDNGQGAADELRALYKVRAEALVRGLRAAGFPDVRPPSGTMFVWTRLPEPWLRLGSVGAASYLIEEAYVATSPGSGFGPGGEGFLRFALIEDPPRIEEACARLGRLLEKDSRKGEG